MNGHQPSLLERETQPDGSVRLVLWYDGYEVQVLARANGDILDVEPWNYRVVDDVLDRVRQVLGSASRA